MNRLHHIVNRSNLAFVVLAALMVGIAVFVYRWDQKDRAEQAAKIERHLTELAERAYFEGQHDAIVGDIRVRYDIVTKRWDWIKSPWDSGKPAIYDPKTWTEDQN